MKKAVITGITGQDGAYLAQFLLEQGYQVYGWYRRTASLNFWRIMALGIKDHTNLFLEACDLTDLSSIIRLLAKIKPDEVYNLAAQSFVAVSFEQPVLTTEVSAIGPLNILEAIRIINPETRFYQASTSEMFGKVQAVPQSEKTPFYPRSPYAVAKLYAHWITINYRESWNIFAASGILFNHESPLRGTEFVTRKITAAVAHIFHGRQTVLELGNLDVKRDWGYAREYVAGMWKMLQTDKPDTYVLATGRTESIRYFCELAFRARDIEIIWEGEGEQEFGRNRANNKVVVRVNPQFFRPAEVDLLIGDAKKANEELDWQPRTSLETLCQLMVDSDCKQIEKGTCFQ